VVTGVSMREWMRDPVAMITASEVIAEIERRRGEGG
jgi:hypothetical protein